MKKMCWMVCIVGVLLTAGVVSTLSARTGPDGGEGDFDIYVSPGQIVKSAPCNCVTIHTDVPYTAVDGVSVAVDEVNYDGALVTFADDCGNLVVKLDFAGVAALVAPPTATIELTVVVDGVASSASADVRVKD